MKELAKKQKSKRTQMAFFEYHDPDLKKFFDLGSLTVDLQNFSITKIPFSVFETSSAPEDLDYPFDSQRVTVRPGLWYALNLAVGGAKKNEIIDRIKEIRSFVGKEIGEYQVSFLIVLPPGASIPAHRHFREQNTIAYCMPTKQVTQGLKVCIEDSIVHVKSGYLNFDSKAIHSAENQTETTYWIFVFENVQSHHNPKLEITEL